MSVIPSDPLDQRVYLSLWPLKQLQINIMPTNQRTRDLVADVMLARIDQDSAEDGHIIAKRLRRINDLDEISDDMFS